MSNGTKLGHFNVNLMSMDIKKDIKVFLMSVLMSRTLLADIKPVVCILSSSRRLDI